MTSLQAFLKLKELLSETSSQSRIDPSLANKAFYEQLVDFHSALCGSVDPALYKDDCLAVLEELCTGKRFPLTKSFQILLRNCYSQLIIACPGYIARNVLNSLLAVCNNKISSNAGRETSLQVLGFIMKTRLNDTASSATDVLQLVARMVKLTDTATRSAALQVLVVLVSSESKPMHDIFPEVHRIVGRLIVDKVVEVRLQTAHLVAALARHSNGFTVLTVEALQASVAKGLEDEDAQVQDASAKAMATIYEVLVRTYMDKQEQSKIGAARGSDDTSKQKAPPSRLSALSKLTSTRKAVVEEINDFKTVFETVSKQTMKSVGAAKVGYLFVLGYFVSGCIDKVSVEEFDLITGTFMSLAQDSVQSTFEEQMLLKTRLSFVFRTGFISVISEAQLLIVAAQMSKLCSTADASNRSDLEVQFALVELNHLLSVLGSAAVSLQDDANACASMQLRHASFGVRTSAANILLTLALIVPGLAAELLENALTNTRTQTQQLMHFDSNNQDSMPDPTLFDDTNDALAGPPGTAAVSVSRKSSVKDMEKMQRMYFFHGHALLLALLLKHINRIPSGVPTALVQEVCSMGLDLMSLGNSSTPPSLKHVVCSINRAGALITSSYLSLGYSRCRGSIGKIILACSKLMSTLQSGSGSSKEMAAPSGQSSPLVNRADEILYEIMTVEAGLVAVTALLSYCSDAITFEEGCLAFIIDSLETCFRNLKNKYQPQYRTHFRFRTFHTILLECFTLLPAGSYPNSCQQIYVEALRVFRDSITASLECSSEMLTGQTLLSPQSSSLSIPFLIKDAVTVETHYVLKLESYCASVQKKECEAFLAIFGKESETLSHFEESHRVDDTDARDGAIHKRVGKFQSSVMDARTLDACIELMAATFSHQSSEYQDKAIQLFAQAASQLVGGVTQSRMSITSSAGKSLGLFGNDEERKKKEKKGLIAVKNIVCALGAIVQAFPLHSGQYFDLDYTWRQALVDNLYDMLSQPSYAVQLKAAQSLALFAAKWSGSNILSSVTMKIRSSIMSLYEKRGASHSMSDFSGHMLALGNLWSAAEDGDMRSLIQTTLFDCLRKGDGNAMLQSTVFVALASICDAQLQSSDHGESLELVFTGNKEVVQDFVDNGIHASKANLASFSFADDHVLFMISMLNQLSRSLALALFADLSLSTVKSLQSLLLQAHLHIGENQLLMEEFCKGLRLIAKFDSKASMCGFVCQHGRTILQDAQSHSLMTILSIVETIRSVVRCNPKAVSDLESLLLTAAEVCVSKGIASCLCNQTVGVEIKSDTVRLMDSMDFGAECLRSIWLCIEEIMHADISGDIDGRLTYWILLNRSIALDLTGRIAEAEEPTPIESETPMGDDALDRGDVETMRGEGSHSLNVESFRLFVQLYRDACTRNAPRSLSWRLFVKTKAMGLVCKALGTYGKKSLIHVDILAARERINDMLQAANHTLSSSQLISMPCFYGLLLTDLVNMCCACATFTINEKPILAFQIQAMNLLQQVVSLFVHTIDPDHAANMKSSTDSGDARDSKILVQFLSQILGAVRTCLPIRHNPAILLSTGEILSVLIGHGLLRDKMILRRILKPFVSFCTDELHGSDLKVISKQCNDQVALEEQLVYVSMIASLLHSTSAANRSVVDKDVVDTVNSLFSDSIPDLSKVWQAVVMDTLRIDYCRMTADPILDIHPLRGGLLYTNGIHHVKLMLANAAPAVALALLSQDRVNNSNEVIMAIFLLLQSRVEEVCNSGAASCNTTELGNILNALELLVKKKCDIPFVAWQRILHTVLFSFGDAIAGDVGRGSAIVGLVGSLMGCCAGEDFLPFVIQTSKLFMPCAFIFKEERLQLISPKEFGGVVKAVTALQANGDAAAEMTVIRQLLTLWARVLLSLSQAPITVESSASAAFCLRFCMLASVFTSLLQIGDNGGEVQTAWSITERLFVTAIERKLALSAAAIECCVVLWQLLQEYLRSGRVVSVCYASILEQAVTFHSVFSVENVGDANELARVAFLTTLVQVQAIDKVLFAATLEVLARVLPMISSRSSAVGKPHPLQVLQQPLLPFVLAVFPLAMDSEVRMLLIRILLVVFNSLSTQEVVTDRFLNVTLPAFSKSVQCHQKDAQHLVVCGKALALMARQAGDAFRKEIANISETDRYYLQAAMKAAVLMEQHGNAAQGASGQAASGIKLNMDKYRK